MCFVIDLFYIIVSAIKTVPFDFTANIMLFIVQCRLDVGQVVLLDKLR